MIGNPKWFKRRKHLGWGATPACWQGWGYILAVVALIVGTAHVSLALPTAFQVPIIFAVVALLMVDMVFIMAKLPKDEREAQHEGFSERNVAWVMVVILTLGLIYQAYSSVITKTWMIDYVIVAALAMGIIVKSCSNRFIRDK